MSLVLSCYYRDMANFLRLQSNNDIHGPVQDCDKIFTPNRTCKGGLTTMHIYVDFLVWVSKNLASPNKPSMCLAL